MKIILVMKKLLILAITTVWISQVFADTHLLCDGCSDIGYKQKAENSVGIGMHTVYVFDTVRWKATKWSVEVEKEDGITYRWATKLSMDSVTKNGFDEYRIVIEDVLINVDPIWFGTPTPGPYSSAHQVVGNIDAYNDIYDWYVNQRSWAGHTTAWAGALAVSLTTRISNASPIMEFIFNDGSIIKFTITMISLNSIEFRFEFLYAEDSNGDVLSPNGTDYNPNQPVGALVGDYLGNLGIGYEITDLDGFLSNNFKAGKCYVIDGPCTTNPSGGPHCPYRQVPGTCYYP